MRSADGREIFFYTVSGVDCPVCSIDPVTNTSTNPYCVTCDGRGYLYTYSGVSISGHITWGQADILKWQSGGQFSEGDCRIQVEYTQTILDTLENTVYVMVDGKKCTIRKTMYRGVPQLNRILLDLSEEDV
jgi:hypothetical protein